MSIIGIVTEFDPFHLGHAHLVEQVRRQFGPETTVVAAMSGDFTQRGSCASFDRHLRAQLALLGGVDLVVELPLPWAISSAEAFGQGGILALLAAGVEGLAFGSECGDVDRLGRVACALESPDYPARLKEALTAGTSFAAARQAALTTLVGEEARLLEGPNDLLGVSYLAALRRAGAALSVTAIPRRGPGHNASQAVGGLSSASTIRALLRQGAVEQALTALPVPCRAPVQQAMERGMGPADLCHNQRGLLTRLRCMTPADFLQLPDCSEGLENRLFRAAQAARSLEELYALARSKRYPMARIRRMVLWAYLGLTAAHRPNTLPYLRVLGMNDRGRAQLHRIKKAVPLLTKPAAVSHISPPAQALFALEVRANDLWRLCLPDLSHSAGGQEWRSGPVYLPGQR